MVISHVVNLRERMTSPLPENSFGNIWRFAVAAITKEESNLELHDFLVPVRKVKRKTNFGYAKKLQGENGFSKAWSLKERLIFSGSAVGLGFHFITLILDGENPSGHALLTCP